LPVPLAGDYLVRSFRDGAGAFRVTSFSSRFANAAAFLIIPIARTN